MKIFVDTNVFLRFIDGEKSCVDFLRKIKSDKKIYWVQTVVISELVWVLRSSYDWSVDEVADVVDSFLQTNNLKFTFKCDVSNALKMYREKNVKYNDCLMASVMGPGDKIVSFDNDFDRFEGVKRVEPKDLVKK